MPITHTALAEVDFLMPSSRVVMHNFALSKWPGSPRGRLGVDGPATWSEIAGLNLFWDVWVGGCKRRVVVWGSWFVLTHNFNGVCSPVGTPVPIFPGEVPTEPKIEKQKQNNLNLAVWVSSQLRPQRLASGQPHLVQHWHWEFQLWLKMEWRRPTN